MDGIKDDSNFHVEIGALKVCALEFNDSRLQGQLMHEKEEQLIKTKGGFRLVFDGFKVKMAEHFFLRAVHAKMYVFEENGWAIKK